MLELIKNILTRLIIIVIWLKYMTVMNYGILRYLMDNDQCN